MAIVGKYTIVPWIFWDGTLDDKMKPESGNLPLIVDLSCASSCFLYSFL